MSWYHLLLWIIIFVTHGGVIFFLGTIYGLRKGEKIAKEIIARHLEKQIDRQIERFSNEKT